MDIIRAATAVSPRAIAAARPALPRSSLVAMFAAMGARMEPGDALKDAVSGSGYIQYDAYGRPTRGGVATGGQVDLLS